MFCLGGKRKRALINPSSTFTSTTHFESPGVESLFRVGLVELPRCNLIWCGGWSCGKGSEDLDPIKGKSLFFQVDVLRANLFSVFPGSVQEEWAGRILAR
jgi:hypothetical protein